MRSHVNDAATGALTVHPMAFRLASLSHSSHHFYLVFICFYTYSILFIHYHLVIVVVFVCCCIFIQFHLSFHKTDCHKIAVLPMAPSGWAHICASNMLQQHCCYNPLTSYTTNNIFLVVKNKKQQTFFTSVNCRLLCSKVCGICLTKFYGGYAGGYFNI